MADSGNAHTSRDSWQLKTFCSTQHVCHKSFTLSVLKLTFFLKNNSFRSHSYGHFPYGGGVAQPYSILGVFFLISQRQLLHENGTQGLKLYPKSGHSTSKFNEKISFRNYGYQTHFLPIVSSIRDGLFVATLKHQIL